MKKTATKSVYVVIANEDEKVKECTVQSDLESAQSIFQKWKVVYGGANVCLASRHLDDRSAGLTPDEARLQRLMRGLPDWAEDAVYVDTDIHFDWKDRLRILFRGTVNLRTKTCTENLPGRILTEDVRVHVDRIFPRRRQMMTATVSVPAQDAQNP